MDARQGSTHAGAKSRHTNSPRVMRQVLTAKDGLCATLRASGLSAAETSRFTFPCWSLPEDRRRLRDALRRGVDSSVQSSDAVRGGVEPHAPQGDAGGGNGGGNGGNGGGDSGGALGGGVDVGQAQAGWRRREAFPWRRGLWIVKPARGSVGHGIAIANASELLAAMRGEAVALSYGGSFPPGRAVVSPYLSEPLLHDGRKWDLRTYVLCTSALPMRLYLFTEGVVRYAAAAYGSSGRAAYLTNTHVGKEMLHRGIAPITGTFAALGDHFSARAQRGGGEGEGGGGGGGGEGGGGGGGPLFRGHASMLGAMRRVVGALFLSAEPQFSRFYEARSSRDLVEI